MMQIRPWLRTGWLLTTSVLIVLAGSPAVANPVSGRISTLKEKRREVVQKKGQVEAELRQVKRRQRAALSNFYDSERQLQSTESELRRLRSRIAAKQQEVASAKVRLAEVNQELEKHNQALWNRLTVFYKEGTYGYVDVVLGARDFEQFVDRVTFFRHIAEEDVRLKQKIEETLAEQEALKARLEADERELESMRDSAEEKARRVRVETNRKRQLLSEVRQDRAAYEQAYAEVVATAREIDKVLRELTRPAPSSGGGGGAMSGGFIKPCPGPYTSRFGYRIHPILRTRRFHDGVDIGAGYGTTIRAAAAGRVIRAGYMGAYGKVIMIDHGNGYTTLYGHCSSLLVSGGHVSKGQPIARVGSTGLSTGPHLHFSVFRNGKAVNPLGL